MRPMPDERRPWYVYLGLALVAGVLVGVGRHWAWSFRDAQADRADEVVVTYMCWGNPQQVEVEREIIGRFNDRMRAQGRNVRVHLHLTPTSGYAYKLRLMLAAGAAADVVRVDRYQFPAMASRGYFRPLDDLAAKDPKFDIADFHEVVLREGTYDGKLYGLNVLFGGVVCYYNKDLFARAGLPDPYEMHLEGRWTWSAWEHAARTLTQYGPDGRPTQYGFSMSTAGWPWFWCLFVWRHGGEMLSEDLSASRMDSPEAIAGMHDLHGLLWRLRVSPTPQDATQGGLAFESGRIGMEWNFAGLSPKYRDSVRDFRWDVAPTPQGDDERNYCVVKGNQLAMSARCRHPKEAWEWMTFLTSEEVELELFGDRLRRGAPTRTSILTSSDYLRAERPPFNTDVFPYLLEHARELPIDETWPMWTAAVQGRVEAMLQDPEADVGAYMREAAALANEEIARERARLTAGRGG